MKRYYKEKKLQKAIKIVYPYANIADRCTEAVTIFRFFLEGFAANIFIGTM